ncbi:hypothetical protein [Paenarthrobacter ureafaciens]|uniref:hypothetical protein n=1 Tax=Paenarthrobacter ureafaciens TaxID=37931 RepID=UPI001A983092|nr:hypothetical protein [Paenarthrobacter ureafaciens]
MADIDADLGAVASAVAKLLQGAVLRVPTLPFLASTMHAVHPVAREVVDALPAKSVGPSKSAVIPARTATGLVMLLTQTCDLQERRTIGGDALVLVAPIVRIEGNQQRTASSLAQPKYVPVPWVAEWAFADVGQATSVDRSVAANAEVVSMPQESERRRLAYLLGRPFSRPALPDDLVTALRPLQKIANGRHQSLRRIFDDAVNMIRVLPDEEYSAEHDASVTVIFLVDPDWLPDVPPGDLGQTLGRDPDRVADFLVETFDSDAQDRDALLRRLWNEMLTRIESRINDRLQPDLRVGRVSLTVATHLLPQAYSDSDELDLGHLSLDE